MSPTEPDLLLARTLELAERGRYTTPPNPMVGAIISRRGRVIAEGWHRRAGGPHAEVVALDHAGSRARGADLHVSLEPCVHVGRTPPCVPRIIESGIATVFVAARDPNPLVAGRGIRSLRKSGIRVIEAGPKIRLAAERQNERFRTWIIRKRPFVLAKWAASLDGKIAAASGESRWITGPASRRRALLLREEFDAVLVGAGTVEADDPLLTRRLGKAGGRPFRRVVLDGQLRVPASARLFRNPEDVRVATALPPGHARARKLASRGVSVWSLPGRKGGVDLRRLLERLAADEVTGLLVEGGGETLFGFLRDGLVDRVAVFFAPRVLGGRAAPGGVGGAGFPLDRALRVVGVEHERLGQDWLVTGRVAPRR